MPRFMPISSAIAPLTSTTGACGPVDIAHVRRPIDGSRMQSIVAMITGMASALAARHHRVGGDLAHGADAEARREQPDDFAAVATRRRDHRLDLRVRRRHQRQAVAPAVAHERPLHLVERVEQVGAVEYELGRRARAPSARTAAARRRSRGRWSAWRRAGPSCRRPSRRSASGVLFEKHSGTITGHASGTPKVLRLKRASSSKIAAV